MTQTRERIIDATAALFMRQGYSASGLKEISHASAAPVGSLYHFFPGGKAELAAETLRASGQAYEQLVTAIFDAAPDLLTGIEACFAGAAEVLRTTDYADACPIATVALEVASSDETLRLVTATIFGGWLDAVTLRLIAGGVEQPRASDLAQVVIAALEGGFLLSRVAKDTTAMSAIGAAMVDMVRAELQR